MMAFGHGLCEALTRSGEMRPVADIVSATGFFVYPCPIKGGLLNMSQVFLYTDGSCKGNPGPGGYAAILQARLHERVLTGGAAHTTNNRMELTAVITGLQALKRRCEVTVITDSQYVVTILTGGGVNANHDLVEQVYRLLTKHTITAQQVRGHQGHPFNERADRLAQAAAYRYQQEAQACAR
jgi:ribonuclease HI